MACVSWKSHDPCPDPFEAVVGDFRAYVVHFCKVDDLGESETLGVFSEFLRRVSETALTVDNPKARRILIEVDTVYAESTVVFTDDIRTCDERDVYKIQVTDWNVVQATGGADEEAELAALAEVLRKFERSIRRALEVADLASIRADLHTLGFRLWLYDHDEETPGETWKELPLTDPETQP